MSKKIVFSLSKAMTIILATVFTMLLLVGCPSAEDNQAEDMSGTNVELSGIWESQSISYTFRGKSYSGTIQLRFTDKQLQIKAPHGISKVHGYTRNGISIDIEDPYSSPTITHSFVLEFSEGKLATTLNNLEFMNGISQKLTFNKIQDSASMLEPTDPEEEGSGGNTDIPAVGTEYNDKENNLRYIVNDDRTLSVKAIDSTRENWVCIIPEEYEEMKVTSIEDRAFYGCSGLTSITIPDTVTSIGSDAFWDCSSLTGITIPDTVTSIGYYTFWNCSSLTSITVSDNNKYYKSIDGVLFDKNVQVIIAYPCGKSLNYYAIPDSVTSIGGYAFRGCSSLTDITIPGSVTSIGYGAFYGCSSLTSVIIGNSVTSIEDQTFWNCSSLTSVIIGNSVTSIGTHAFSYCSSLTGIDIPDSVTSIGDKAFYGCSGLTSINIPGSVTSIGDKAFYRCSSLTEIHAESFTKDEWRSLSNNASITNDVTIYLKDGLKDGKIVDGGIIYYLNLDTWERYVVGADKNITTAEIKSVIEGDPVTSIGSYAFRGCSSLTEIHAESFTKDEWRSLSNNASIPINITIYLKDGLKDGKIVDGGIIYYVNQDTWERYVAPADKNITTAEIKSVIEGDPVTSIGDGAFYNCSSLTGITIPSSVTSIGELAFKGCSSLTSINIKQNKQTTSLTGAPWGAPKGESIVKWQGEF